MFKLRSRDQQLAPPHSVDRDCVTTRKSRNAALRRKTATQHTHTHHSSDLLPAMVDLTPASQSTPALPPKMMTSLRVTDDSVLVINQLLLPHLIQWDPVHTIEDAFDSIKQMRVRERRTNAPPSTADFLPPSLLDPRSSRHRFSGRLDSLSRSHPPSPSSS
jgi:hypothetical protein